MGVEIRQHVGQQIFTNETRAARFDEIVCDGEVIGIRFHSERLIRWTRYKKKDIPKRIQKQAVRLCMQKDENRG